jgi:hypothetical protein
MTDEVVEPVLDEGIPEFEEKPSLNQVALEVLAGRWGRGRRRRERLQAAGHNPDRVAEEVASIKKKYQRS